MGPLILCAVVVAIVVILGFAISGMLLGLGTLSQSLKRLFWPQVTGEERGR